MNMINYEIDQDSQSTQHRRDEITAISVPKQVMEKHRNAVFKLRENRCLQGISFLKEDISSQSIINNSQNYSEQQNCINMEVKIEWL